MPSNSEPNTSDWEAFTHSVTWRGKSPQPVFLRRGWQKGACGLLQFGATSQLSMAAAFEDWLTESSADFLARISAWPDGKPELPESTADFGSSTFESFAKLNPDGSLSKMSRQCSIWETEEPYSENLPSWGSMRNGELCQRPAWVPRISESEFSFLPTEEDSWRTPCSRDHHPSSLHNPNRIDQSGGNPDRVGRFGTEHGGRNLADDVTMWATPNAHDGRRPGADMASTQGGNLNRDAVIWPSPQSRDWKLGDASVATANANSRPLNEAAERWNTPTATDAKKSDDGPKSIARREAGEMLTSDQRLCNQVQDFHSSHPAQATLAGRPCWCGTRGCSLPSHKRRLNPIFASWLQGWPIWWCTKEPTPYGQWATESWLSRARLYLESLSGASVRE